MNLIEREFKEIENFITNLSVNNNDANQYTKSESLICRVVNK